MANKDFEVTIGLTMVIGAEDQEMAVVRGGLLAQAAREGIWDTAYRWKPEHIEPSDVKVEES